MMARYSTRSRTSGEWETYTFPADADIRRELSGIRRAGGTITRSCIVGRGWQATVYWA
jgi:hypothetical protein